MKAQQTQESNTAIVIEQIKNAKNDTAKVNKLLSLSLCYVNKFKRIAAHLDSAQSFALEAEQLSNKLGYSEGLGNSYLLLSKINFAKKDIVRSEQYANRAKEVFTKAGLHADLGEVYFELSAHYSLSDTDLEKRVQFISMALEAFLQSGRQEKIAYTYRELADLHQIQGNRKQALAEIKKSIAIYEANKYPLVYGAYDLESMILFDMQDYRAALKYSLLAIQKIEEAHDTTLQLCTAYNRAGVIHFQFAQYTEALEFHEKSLGVADRYHDTASILVVMPNLLSTLNYLKDNKTALLFLKKFKPYYNHAEIEDQVILNAYLSQVYTDLGQLADAIVYFQQLQSLIEKTKDQRSLGLYYRTAIKYLFAAKQYGDLYNFLKLDESYMREVNSPGGIAGNHYYWYKADSATGNYLSAIRHFLAYKLIKDSINKANYNKQIAELQLQFETEKKDKDIELKGHDIQVLKKQTQLQQTELKQANLIRNLILIGVALLLGIIVLLFNRYSIKQKAHKQLEVKQQEITEKNNSLQHLLDEKEWLLKEIHHRVKNNLQTITSLLISQSAYLENDAALSAIQDSQHRVNVMSLIHQKLYNSENVSTINMLSYIQELVEYMRDCFNTGQRIRFETAIAPVELDVSQAIPVGLILNEAITNSLKYAFPGDRKGVINISLQNTGDDNYLLTITDNGIGIPADVKENNRDSLGMNLMKGLSEDLEGKLFIENNNGTILSLSFRQDIATKKMPETISITD